MSAVKSWRATLGRRHILVGVSGGKDSTAMWRGLRDLGLEVTPVFLDTGYEHKLTYEYLEYLEHRLEQPIVRVKGPYTMESLIRAKQAFPARFQGFCTVELKVKPMQAFIERWLEEHEADVVNAIGLRAEESTRRANMTHWEPSPHFPCDVWRPILDWKMQDVVDMHRRHDLRPNPLYLRGATRVGCRLCKEANKADIDVAARTDPGVIEWIEKMEDEIGEGVRARREARGEEPYEQTPTFIKRSIPGAHGSKFVPIADVVAWSKTEHGGRRMRLFDPPDDAGCSRWGMCEPTKVAP